MRFSFIQFIRNKIRYFKKVRRWKRAAKLVAKNSAEVNEEFRRDRNYD